MTAPIKRISPELDALIAQLAEQESVTYVEASRKIAESQVRVEVPRDVLNIWAKMGMFKKR